MTHPVLCDIQDGVATLTLNNGKVNAISPSVIEHFNDALDQAEKANAVVVIKGSPGMLSAGYDLNVMKGSLSDMQALVQAGSTLTRRLLAFPTPVVVACTGHAVAKGAFILLAADYRLGVNGEFKIGLNEVAIGMTMHSAGIALAKGRLETSYYQRSVVCAEMFGPEEAVKAGFLDHIVAPENFDATLNHIVSGLKKLDPIAHAKTKIKARQQWLSELDNAIEIDANMSLS